MLTVILVAAGSSTRIGFDKLFAPLGGKPVVAYSIIAFERCACVDRIIVVGRKERLDEIKKIVSALRANKVTEIIAGGLERQDSVRRGLEHLDSESRFVAVHDAARPLITPEQIERVFACAQTHGAAAAAEPVTDTLKRATADCFVCHSVDRQGLYAMQTPQIFSRELLLRAYDAVAEKQLSITDEVSAVELIGEKVLLVPNEQFNFKITYAQDLKLAEFVIQERAAKE